MKIILSCGSLLAHVKAAQQKMQTNYPVVVLDRKYHAEPSKMRWQIIKKMRNLPDEIDTVLVAMGFCGGSWNVVPLAKRVVIPKVDDCITLLLHKDDAWQYNLKEKTHIYLRDGDNGAFSFSGIQKSLCEKHGAEKGRAIFNKWFAPYTDVDIIDTGAYDCHSEEYLAAARKNADLTKCRLNHAEGSNILLEKLVSGRWDSQFLIAEAGEMFSKRNFLE